jgi:hypothetical protein
LGVQEIQYAKVQNPKYKNISKRRDTRLKKVVGYVLTFKNTEWSLCKSFRKPPAARFGCTFSVASRRSRCAAYQRSRLGQTRRSCDGSWMRHMPLSSRIANQSQIDSCAFWPVGRVVKAIHTAPVTVVRREVVAQYLEVRNNLRPTLD